MLVAAKLNLDALQGRFGDETLRSEASRVAQLLDDSITWLPLGDRLPEPPILQQAGLAGSLGWLARQMQERHGFQVTLSVCEDWVEPVDANLKAFLFEAVRESSSTSSSTRERWPRGGGAPGDGRPRDRGGGRRQGVRPKGPPGACPGRGALRALLHPGASGDDGGSMSVESAPGHGTRVTLRAPGGRFRRGSGRRRSARGRRREKRGRAGANPDRPGRIRVVIADDHRIFRQASSHS